MSLNNKNLELTDLYLFEFRMRQSVDDGVPGAGSFGEKNGKLIHHRADKRWITPSAKHRNNHKRSPGGNPSHDVDAGHFGSAHFGRKLLLFWSAPEGSDVHFLGLFTKRFLVIEDGSNNVNVATDNEDDVENDGNGHRQDKSLVINILTEIVVRAPEKKTTNQTLQIALTVLIILKIVNYDPSIPSMAYICPHVTGAGMRGMMAQNKLQIQPIAIQLATLL